MTNDRDRHIYIVVCLNSSIAFLFIFLNDNSIFSSLFSVIYFEILFLIPLKINILREKKREKII